MQVKIIVLLIYVAGMILIGYFSMKKTKTVGDFFLANRSLGPWVSAFAYGSSYFSAVLFWICRKYWLGIWSFQFMDCGGKHFDRSLLAWLVLARAPD